MRLNARGFVSLGALLPLTLVPSSRLGVRAALPVDGYVFTMQLTGSEMASPGSMTFKVAGDKMRLETDQMAMGMGRGGGGMDATGAYILPHGEGKVTIVLPQMSNPMSGGTGMAIAMDIAAMAGGARGRGPAPAPNEAPGTVEDLGAGESVAGHPTHRYRLKSSTGDSETEVWMSTDLAGVDFKKFVGSFGARFGGGANAATVAKMPTGFPLKTVTNTTSANGKTTTSMQVTQIEKASFDAAVFDVPAGIQVMDFGGMMGGRGRGGH